VRAHARAIGDTHKPPWLRRDRPCNNPNLQLSGGAALQPAVMTAK